MRVIVTGVTGMVGEGVMHEMLNKPKVEEVLALSRKSSGYSHPKLKEILHQDFFDISSISADLKNYDACFFCLGVSSVGMKEEEYHKLTYELTLHVAETLSKNNPQMTFCYVSGAGTDSSEKGKSMWARVKGKTENHLAKLPFKAVYNFRPGFILPIEGMKFTNKFYKYVNWLFPIGRLIYPKGFCKLTEIAEAMYKVSAEGYSKQNVEGDDIISLGQG